jgi:kumamolisin
VAEQPSLVAVPGSTRLVPPHKISRAVASGASAAITLYVRGRGDPVPGRLTREEYAANHGAAAADVETVRQFAASRGLTVGVVNLGRRSVEIAGDVDSLATTFGTTLSLYQDADGVEYRGRSGELFVPAELDGIVVGVFGLDERPQARPQFRPRADATSQYTPPQIAAAYAFPPGLTGKGECIGLIELGGGFRTDDITAYFSMLGITPPQVVAVPVDGGSNAPGTPDGPDGEVMLDIEVTGSIASGATIAVYFAPNTDQGFIDAVTTAIHDTEHRPSVLSISWGSAESTWTGQAMTQMEQAFAAAASMGVTVTAAAGDNGSSDGASDGLQHADFPASAPHALGCGGTRLKIAGGSISAETVWNDGSGNGAGGGGISDVFPVPEYQHQAAIPPSANPGGHAGRGVPDVCGDADPDTGYTVRVDGETIPIGGTSAVAPLWAGLIALLNEGLGKPVGFLHPFLYSAGINDVRDIVEGSNGAYSAGPGWDACTGLGSPNGTAILKGLTDAASAALPEGIPDPLL